MKNQLIEESKNALAECLQTVRAEDAQAYAGIAAALHAGAVAQITVSLSLAGMAQTNVDLLLPTGQKLNLGHFEYEPLNATKLR